MTYKCPDCGHGINFNHQGCKIKMNITKLIELQAAATTGPWEVRYEHPEVRTIAYIKAPGRILEVCTIFGCDGVNEETSNAELIEAARNFDFAALDEKIKRYEDALRVHDELITQAPDNDNFSAEGLSNIMSRVPVWADGLPLAAGGFESYRYKKE